MKPLDKDAPIAKRRRNLPHWEQAGCTYFITWRLADSIPAETLRGWIAERDLWLKLNPRPWSVAQTREYEREFAARIERWLDAGHGACVLRQPAVRGIVEGALRHFAGERYALEAFVVMPNHVHVLVTPQCDTGFPAREAQAGKPVSHSHSLAGILQSWKGYSAREINRLLGQHGTLWMDENFDHVVRSSEQLAHFRRYLRENPAKAGLREGEFTWWECDTGFPACAEDDSQAGKPVSLSPPYLETTIPSTLVARPGACDRATRAFSK